MSVCASGRCGNCGRCGRRSSTAPTRSIWSATPHRRGSASVAILLVLVIFSLFIVTMVVGGAGDHELAARRIEGVRAFYAAEAGVNMALRELATGVDEDGDGGIGTISDDGDPATNPALVGASVSVGFETAGDFVTLRSRGIGGAAQRVIEVLAEKSAGAGEPIVMAAYGKDGNNRPAYRIWNRAANEWGPEALANGVGDVPDWIVLRGHPDEQRFAMAVLGNDQRLSVQFYDVAAGTWSAPFFVTTNAGERVSRVFDMAFEQASGRLVVVYRRGSSNSVGIRVHDGSSAGVWSGESTFSPHNKPPQWVDLVPQPGGSTMLLVSSTDENGKHSQVASWSGSTFSANWHDAGLSVSDYDHLSAAYGPLGAVIAVYAAPSNVMYRRLSGGSWSQPSNLAGLGSTPNWNRVVAQPGGDEMVLATLTENKRVLVNVWNGSFWGSNLQVTASAGDNNRRGFDIAYEFGTGRPLVLYDRGTNTLRYRTWNGSSWSGEMNAPGSGGGSGPIWTVQARTGIVNAQIFAIWASDDSNILAAVWDGSSFSSALNLGKSSAPKEYEPFMIAVANAGGAGGSESGGDGAVLAWGEAAP